MDEKVFTHFFFTVLKHVFDLYFQPPLFDLVDLFKWIDTEIKNFPFSFISFPFGHFSKGLCCLKHKNSYHPPLFFFDLIHAFCMYVYSSAAAFAPNNSAQRSVTELNAERREFMSQAAAVAGLAAFAPAANAIRDYDAVGLLGGGQIVDVNNANIRVYLKMPGLYPAVAGKIASNGPYKSVSDLYSITGLTGPEKDMIKKYESRFAVTPPSADYVIDRINNGLYR